MVLTKGCKSLDTTLDLHLVYKMDPAIFLINSEYQKSSFWRHSFFVQICGTHKDVKRGLISARCLLLVCEYSWNLLWILIYAVGEFIPVKLICIKTGKCWFWKQLKWVSSIRSVWIQEAEIWFLYVSENQVFTFYHKGFVHLFSETDSSCLQLCVRVNFSDSDFALSVQISQHLECVSLLFTAVLSGIHFVILIFYFHFD